MDPRLVPGSQPSDPRRAATRPGLGDSLIQAILQRRQELGRFDSLDQLTSISGIKEQRLRSLSRYLKILNPHPDPDDQ